MKQPDIGALSRFEAVWQRVQNEKTLPQKTEIRNMEALMDGIYDRMTGCRSLAEQADGCAGKRMTELCEQLGRRYSRLQLLYFLETGDVYFARCTTKFASYTPYNLRKLWQTTVENQKMLESCELNGNEEIIAEIHLMKVEFEEQKKQLEAMIEALLH